MMLVSEGNHVSLARFAVQLQSCSLVVVLCSPAPPRCPLAVLPDTCLGSTAFSLWDQGLGLRVLGFGSRVQCTLLWGASVHLSTLLVGWDGEGSSRCSWLLRVGTRCQKQR